MMVDKVSCNSIDDSLAETLHAGKVNPYRELSVYSSKKKILPVP